MMGWRILYNLCQVQGKSFLALRRPKPGPPRDMFYENARVADSIALIAPWPAVIDFKLLRL
jgi:hypothetical protein